MYCIMVVLTMCTYMITYMLTFSHTCSRIRKQASKTFSYATQPRALRKTAYSRAHAHAYTSALLELLSWCPPFHLRLCLRNCSHSSACTIAFCACGCAYASKVQLPAAISYASYTYNVAQAFQELSFRFRQQLCTYTRAYELQVTSTSWQDQVPI